MIEYGDSLDLVAEMSALVAAAEAAGMEALGFEREP